MNERTIKMAVSALGGIIGGLTGVSYITTQTN